MKLQLSNQFASRGRDRRSYPLARATERANEMRKSVHSFVDLLVDRCVDCVLWFVCVCSRGLFDETVQCASLRDLVVFEVT